MRRLLPEFWGDEADDDLGASRLYALLIHTLRHLLNLEHLEQADNYMYGFTSVSDLDHMDHPEPEQPC